MTLPFGLVLQTTARGVNRCDEESDAVCSSIAQQLQIDDPKIQYAREDGVLAVARVILDRRLGIAPGTFVGSTTQDKCDYLRMQVPNFDRESSGVLLHDTCLRVTAVKSLFAASLTAVPINPREIGREALLANAFGAHFIALQGQNHLFLQDEPASERFFEEIKLLLSH